MIYFELFGLQINLFAQIAGTIGMVVLVWSYQLKKVRYLIVSTAAMAIFLLESCLLYADADTFTGIVLNAAAIVRNLLMLFSLLRFRRELPVWAALLLLALVWAICAPRLGAWYTWLPPVLQTVYTLCSLSKNYFVLKGGALILEGGNLFYNASVGAYIGVLRQVVLVTGVIVGTISYALRQKSAQKKRRISAAMNMPALCPLSEEKRQKIRMQQQIDDPEQRKMRGIEDVEQPFEVVSAAPPAVKCDQWQRKQAGALRKAVDRNERHKVGKEQKHDRPGPVERRKHPAPALRAEIEQPDADGERNARNAVIDMDGRKTAQPHRERHRQYECSRAQHDPSPLPGERIFFEGVQRVDDEAGKGERDQDIPVQRSPEK